MGSMDETETAYLNQRIAELEGKHQLQTDLYHIERRSGKRCLSLCGIFLVLWLLTCSVLTAIIFSKISTIPEIRRDQVKTNERVKQIVSKDQELEERISEIRNAPFGYFCGYQNSFSTANSVIKYDKLLYSSQSGLQKKSAGIDINTGKFVSGFSGTWRVDFSLRTKPDAGEDIYIYLYKNGQKIPETWFVSSGSSDNYGWDWNTGGRSVLLHLDVGDELYLGSTYMEDSARDIIFCVSLEQVDA